MLDRMSGRVRNKYFSFLYHRNECRAEVCEVVDSKPDSNTTTELREHVSFSLHCHLSSSDCMHLINALRNCRRKTRKSRRWRQSCWSPPTTGKRNRRKNRGGGLWSRPSGTETGCSGVSSWTPRRQKSKPNSRQLGVLPLGPGTRTTRATPPRRCSPRRFPGGSNSDRTASSAAQKLLIRLSRIWRSDSKVLRPLHCDGREVQMSKRSVINNR